MKYIIIYFLVFNSVLGQNKYHQYKWGDEIGYFKFENSTIILPKGCSTNLEVIEMNSLYICEDDFNNKRINCLNGNIISDSIFREIVIVDEIFYLAISEHTYPQVGLYSIYEDSPFYINNLGSSHTIWNEYYTFVEYNEPGEFGRNYYNKDKIQKERFIVTRDDEFENKMRRFNSKGYVVDTIYSNDHFILFSSKFVQDLYDKQKQEKNTKEEIEMSETINEYKNLLDPFSKMEESKTEIQGTNQFNAEVYKKFKYSKDSINANIAYKEIEGKRKFGVFNDNGKLLIPFDYRSIYFINDKVCIVKNDKEYLGIVDLKNEVVLPCIFKAIRNMEIDSSLWKVQTKSNKFGAVNLEGEFKIDTIYDRLDNRELYYKLENYLDESTYVELKNGTVLESFGFGILISQFYDRKMSVAIIDKSKNSEIDRIEFIIDEKYKLLLPQKYIEKLRELKIVKDAH